MQFSYRDLPFWTWLFLAAAQAMVGSLLCVASILAFIGRSEYKWWREWQSACNPSRK
jgi:hypothetical protein